MAEVERIVRERLVAAQKGDVATWSRNISPHCVWAGPGLELATTAGVAREITADSALPPRPPDEVRDFSVRVFGGVAIATYVSIERRPDGRVAKQFRKTDTYARRGKTWQLISAVESFVPPRQSVLVDPSVFDQYVGQYELDPKRPVTLWRAGPRLLSQAPDEKEPTELLPAGGDTFFVDGELGDYVFQRNQEGRVTGLAFRMGAAEVVALKTK